MRLNRRTLLAAVTALLGLSGLAVAAWPFVAALGPSATAGRTLPHLPIQGIAPGEYAYFDSGFGWGSRREYYLVIRPFDGSYNLVTLDMAHGRFIMPDVHWWGESGTCDQLSLAFPKGRLEPGGTIRCMDADKVEWFGQHWQWSYTGKNFSGYYADLYSPPFVVEDDDVVVGKWRWP